MIEPWRVVIAGGGVAGIEALLGLAALGERRLQIALVTPGDRFILRPYAVAEPFGGAPSPSVPLADIARQHGARFIRDRVVALRPDAKVVELRHGSELPYDALIVAVGAVARPMHPAALTFFGPQSTPEIQALVGDLTRRRVESVAVIIPEGVTWPLPMYELALLIRGRAQQRPVTLATSEPAPLAIFGDEPSGAIAELLASAGVTLHVHADPRIGEHGTSIGLSAAGPWYRADRIVAPPLLDGPRLAGLPHDASGFIPTDDYGRVPGLDRVYAAGDGTTVAVKQGGLAAQQADAAVRHIVSEAGGLLPPTPFRPVLRGRFITGGLDRYLRHDPDGGDAVLDEPLWEPAAKVVGHYLAPWLAYDERIRTHRSHLQGIAVERDLELEPLGPLRPRHRRYTRGLELEPRERPG